VRELAQRGIGHARAAGERRLESELGLWLVSALAAGLSHVAEADALCQEALDTFASDLVGAAFTKAWWALNHARQLRFDEAREVVKGSVRTLDELGRKLDLGGMSHFEGQIELLAGEPAAAERALRTGFRQLENLGEKGFASTSAALLAESLTDQGRKDEAEALTYVSERYAGPRDVVSQTRWRAARARAVVLTRPGEAVRIANEAVRLAAATEDFSIRSTSLINCGEVLQAAERHSEASSILREALALCTQKGDAASRRRVEALLSRA